MTDIYGCWIDLKNAVLRCDKCSAASEKRLFDYGNRESSVMIVGDRASEADFSEQRVFSGESGMYVTQTLALVDIPFEKVYMTNIVKCRVAKNYSEAADVCINHLRKQFALLKPRLVVCIGELAARKLISDDFSVDEMHGKIITKGKTLFTATFSPETFAKNSLNRDLFLSDFLKIRKWAEKMGNPFLLTK